MAKANLVQKKVQMSKRNIIKYQLLTHFFNYNESFSNNEIESLALLGVYGKTDLPEFCNAAVNEKIFKSIQSVRNFITKANKKDIVLKDKKRIFLNPKLQIQTEGNIILDYKMFYVTQE